MEVEQQEALATQSPPREYWSPKHEPSPSRCSSSSSSGGSNALEEAIEAYGAEWDAEIEAEKKREKKGKGIAASDDAEGGMTKHQPVSARQGGSKGLFIGKSNDAEGGRAKNQPLSARRGLFVGKPKYVDDLYGEVDNDGTEVSSALTKISTSLALDHDGTEEGRLLQFAEREIPILGNMQGGIPGFDNELDGIGLPGFAPSLVLPHRMQQSTLAFARDVVMCPYVCDKEPLSALLDEFKENPIFSQKVEMLSSQYPIMRRVERDGNCFFRAFMFSLMEQILNITSGDVLDDILLNLIKCKTALESCSFTSFSLTCSLTPRGTAEDEPGSNSIRPRYATSYEMRMRPEFFEPFIGYEAQSIEQYCRDFVEPMGVESEHPHLIALADALGVRIRLACIDSRLREDGTAAVNFHNFPEEADGTNSKTGANKKLTVILLYRPGHYDLLYEA